MADVNRTVRSNTTATRAQARKRNEITSRMDDASKALYQNFSRYDEPDVVLPALDQIIGARRKNEDARHDLRNTALLGVLSLIGLFSNSSQIYMNCMPGAQNPSRLSCASSSGSLVGSIFGTVGLYLAISKLFQNRADEAEERRSAGAHLAADLDVSAAPDLIELKALALHFANLPSHSQTDIRNLIELDYQQKGNQ